MVKRRIFENVVETYNSKKIPLIMGLRRVGKTTILNQIVEIDSNAKIITWDDFSYMQMDDTSFYKLIDSECSSGGTILFDEVQVRKDWDVIIKNMFDKYVSKGICKIVATGSSSMILAGKDLGVTRVKKIQIDTWDFDEYISFTKKEKNIETFEEYLGKGFPEYMEGNATEAQMLNEALKPILEDDIPKSYPGTDTMSLSRFISALAYLTNGEVNETSLAKKVGISIITARKYIDILERALILRRVYKIHEDLSFPKKKAYKVYLNPHIHLWLLDKKFKDVDPKAKGHIIEAYWLTWVMTKINNSQTFYYLKDSKSDREIDFVSVSGNTFKTLHEFKYRNDISQSDALTLMKLNSINKVIWSKYNKDIKGVKVISILDINDN